MEIIEKIARTDKDTDNSAYVLKIPYTHTDDFGNEGTFYRKETVTIEQLASMEKDLNEKKKIPDLSEEEAKIAMVKTEHAKDSIESDILEESVK
jgi:hypothetical protein